MSTLALPSFNPLQFANRLKDAGVPAKQAEAEAEVLREVFDARDMVLSELERRFNTQETLSKKEAEQMATKGDVFAVKADVFAVKGDVLKLDAKVDLVRKDVELVDQRSQARFKLLYWMLGVILAGVGAVFAKMFLG